MKTFIVNSKNPSSFEETNFKCPIAKGRDVLIRVKSIAPCEVDVALRTKRVGEVIGTDAAGIIVETGRDVKGFRVGDEVYYHSDHSREGCHSEFHLINEERLARKPVSMSFEEAATMPGSTLLAYESLFDSLQVDPEVSRGKSLLITNSRCSVSAMVVQLAANLTNLVIFTIASNDEEAEYMQAMGADYILDDSFSLDTQLKHYGLKRVDFIFSIVKEYDDILRIRSITDRDSRATYLISSQHENEVMNHFDSRLNFEQDFIFCGESQCSSLENQGERLKEIAELIDAGAFESLLTANLGIIDEESLAYAHRMVENDQLLGKVVLNYSE
ncbi:alcohol dehydrogenase catalytic domain-containing protein [Halobacteriovorax sp. DPLXC-1]|uniref:alcohol dehydrogenase catalytic domain-containing protein n=1 Tax=Halobacteriovorax sp. DPLXC-1 TaxID=3110771 RepID=UPI002FEFB67C